MNSEHSSEEKRPGKEKSGRKAAEKVTENETENESGKEKKKRLPKDGGLPEVFNAGYYIEKFLKIRDKNGRLIPLLLNEPQKRFYEAFARQWRENKPVRIIILKARQMGFSTLTEAILFFLTATNFNRESLIVAHNDDASERIFEMSRRFFDNLPPEVRPSCRGASSRRLVFGKPKKSGDGEKSGKRGLESALSCATAGGSGIGRSYTLSCLHLSEFAFWPGDKMSTYLGLAQAVPDAPGTVIVIESTANGYDSFKKLWDSAVEASARGEEGYLPLFFAWHEMKSYRRSVDPGFSRTEEEQRLAAAYGLDDEQLSWRRWCIRNNCGGDVELFRQEYPSSPDEAFISTGRCAFDKEKLILRRAAVAGEKPEYGSFLPETDFSGKIVSFAWRKENAGNSETRFAVRIFRHPEKGAPYVIGADTAGTGTDFFAAQVLDNRTGEQVAVLHQRFGEREFARQLYCLGKYYNDALIGIETNYSTYPELCLEDLGYTRLYVRQRFDTFTGKTVDSFGFETTPKTRPVIIDGLKDVVSHTPELINDHATLGEMLTFVYDENWKPQAEAGEHDDLVMSLAIAFCIRSQQSYTSSSPSGGSSPGEWNDDQWEDYLSASETMKAAMVREWGEPPGRR